jgi:hypothetical protein
VWRALLLAGVGCLALAVVVIVLARAGADAAQAAPSGPAVAVPVNAIGGLVFSGLLGVGLALFSSRR